jgi:hypothetical protein
MQNRTDPNGLPAGADIYDATGELIGTLDTWNAQEGYLAVLKGVFITKGIFLPLGAVDYTDLDGIHLNLRKDELQDSRYEAPPISSSSSSASPASDADLSF